VRQWGTDETYWFGSVHACAVPICWQATDAFVI
jgi:hypothetical protein